MLYMTVIILTWQNQARVDQEMCEESEKDQHLSGELQNQWRDNLCALTITQLLLDNSTFI